MAMADFAAITVRGVFAIIPGIIAAIFALGIVVFVHELGHYIIAKRVGIKVEAFSIGFGPKIWGFKRGDTEYKICLIFVGGYVKLAGMESGNGKPLHEIEGGFYAAKPASRSLCAFMGSFNNFVLAFLVFTLLWFTGRKVPDAEVTTTIGAVEEDYPAEKAGLLPGDTILEINGKKMKEWRDIFATVAFAGKKEAKIKFEREGKIFIRHIKPKWDKQNGVYRLPIHPKSDTVVISVVKGSVAEKMGLTKNDIILKLNETPFYFLPLFHQKFREKLKENIGKEITLTVLRDGKKVQLKTICPEPEKGEEFPKLNFRLGARFVTKKENPIRASAFVFNIFYKTIKGLIARRVSTKGLMGPVGIISSISMSIFISFTYFLWLVALIGLAIAIFNLLPLPVFDGGHILFALLEKIRRKPFSEKTLVTVTNVFAILLIIFAIYVTRNDILRFFTKEKVKPKPEKQIEKPTHQLEPAPNPTSAK